MKFNELYLLQMLEDIERPATFDTFTIPTSSSPIPNEKQEGLYQATALLILHLPRRQILLPLTALPQLLPRSSSQNSERHLISNTMNFPRTSQHFSLPSRGLPFGLIPFAFSQFILIEALSHQGWIDVFANWLVRASHGQMIPTIWLIGVLGVILCNVAGTNIGATILLTKIVRAAERPQQHHPCGGDCTCIGEQHLRGELHVLSKPRGSALDINITTKRECTIKQATFAFWNLLPIFVMTIVGLGSCDS